MKGFGEYGISNKSKKEADGDKGSMCEQVGHVGRAVGKVVEHDGHFLVVEYDLCEV